VVVGSFFGAAVVSRRANNNSQGFDGFNSDPLSTRVPDYIARLYALRRDGFCFVTIFVSHLFVSIPNRVDQSDWVRRFSWRHENCWSRHACRTSAR
jgi:hypothetical protein